MLYERYHNTRDQGLQRHGPGKLPILSFFMLVMTLSSIGLPGMNGFAGELLILVGMFQRAWVQVVSGPVIVYRAISVLGRVWCRAGGMVHALAVPACLLWTASRTGCRTSREDGTPLLATCLRAKWASLIPIVVLVFWIGIQPSFFLDRMRPTLDRLTVGVMRTSDDEIRSRLDDVIPQSAHGNERSEHRVSSDVLWQLWSRNSRRTDGRVRLRRWGLWDASRVLGRGLPWQASGWRLAALATTAPLTNADPLLIDSLATLVEMARARPWGQPWFSWHGPNAAILTGRKIVGSLMLVVTGMMLVSAAGELILIFLGLELISIPTYILLFVGRRNLEGRESAAKYFYLSILASAVLLFGLCFLYGSSGSTSLGNDQGPIIGTLAYCGGGPTGTRLRLRGIELQGRRSALPLLCSRRSTRGTTYPNAALLSVAPKLAGFLALVRLAVVATEGIPSHSWRIALALAVLTMTNLVTYSPCGRITSAGLLAYSSVAHAGYMLIGVGCGFGHTRSGPGVAFDWYHRPCCSICCSTRVATCGHLCGVGLPRIPKEQPVQHVDALAGLAWCDQARSRLLAWMLAAFMFSLAGIPPLAGFWGKLALFGGAFGSS